MVTVNTAWLAIAGGSNSTNATVTSSTAGYGSIVGHNSFYLPMDGNSPIGKDQSGNGNDWTPVNFGGSVDLPKATGAPPILKTNEAGTVAKPGVRTDKKTYTVTASGGNYYLDGALKPTLNAYRGGSYTFDYTGATSHPLYLSSLPDGKHNSKAYSVEFDGTGDYLGVTGNSDYDFGTGDFTIEGYFYTTNNNGTIASSQNYYSGGSNGNWLIRISSATQLAFASYDGTGNEEYTEFTAQYQTNTWHHFAFVRSGTTLTCYLDGSSVGTMTVSKSLSDGSNGILIGEDSADLNPEFNGKISNFRINKGTALYTSNFTPPSTTLTNVTGTTLLCCQDSSATTGAVLPSGSTIAANGNAAASNTSPFLYDINGYYGVNTGTSNTTKITIPHWAADTLYYYCNAHSGMGSSINVTTDIFKADPYAWKNVLANPLVGTANDVSNQINSGTTEKVMTVSGATTNTAGNFYGGSHKFVAASSQQITTPGSSDFAFGTGDFCVECWYYNDTSGGGATYNQLVGNIESSAAGFWRIGSVFGGGNQFWFTYTNGNYNDVSTDQNINDGRWHHLAATRQSGTLRLFVDGVVHATATVTQNFSQTTTLRMMYSAQQPGYANGYLQDVRVYKGVAKYTENFAVGSTVPDVLSDSPSGITGKTNLTKITNGAVYFDGSSEQHMDAGSALINTNNSFCVEAFAYLLNNPTSSDMGMICSQYASGVPAGRMLYGFQDGYLALRINGTAVQLQSAAGSIGPNLWYHTAWTWDGTTHRLFLNGKLVDSSTTVPAPYTGTNTEIGGNAALNAYDIKGYISNFRIVTGSAVYTEDFTPPTEKLTNITNTSLLCCQSNTQPSAAVVGPRVSGVNNGTGWSSSLKSNSRFRSGFPGWKAFNGTTKSSTNDCAATPQTAGQGFTFTFGGGVPFTTLQMQCDPNGSGGATVRANGVDITSQLTNGSLTNTTITGVTSPLTSLSLFSRSGDAGYLGSITIDGTMLVDPLIRNSSTIVATNFNPLTEDINAIRGQASGYATWNPLTTKGVVTTSGGNLVADTVQNGNGWALSTIPMTSGKYYCEMNFEGEMSHNTNFNYIGIVPTDIAETYTGLDIFRGLGALAIESNASKVRASIGTGSGATQSDWNTSIGYDERSTIGIAIDCDTPLVKFYVDGKDVGTYPYTMAANKSWVVFCNDWASGYQDFEKYILNAGQKPFKFLPPDGFQPMNLSNVQPEKVIARPDQYVGVSLWTGNGTSQDITGLKHKPDLVWIKSRSFSNNHHLFDSVRGPNKILRSSTQDQETTVNVMTSFNNDGFTVAEAGGNNATNDDTSTFVGWTWKAGGSKGTFNVDDVGYANASDVNMNVGSLNSSAYDQSQRWRNYITSSNGFHSSYGPERAFNGVFDGDGGLATSAANGVVTFTPPAMTVTSLEVNCYSNVTITLPDGTTRSVTGSGTVDNMRTVHIGSGFSFTGSNSIVFTPPNGVYTYIERIKINGKELVDDDVTVTNVPSIAPTGCSVGTKQGFSIIKWQGDGSNANRTVPHGLLEAPSFVIVKPLTEARHWLIWHKDYNDDDAAMLFDAGTPAGARFGPNAPTSNVFGVYGGQGNRGTTDFIGYCWHDVLGLQKFGTYEGLGGTANGSFVELGFRPAIVWVKNIDTASQSNTHWCVFDNLRPGFNKSPAQNRLHLDQNVQEDPDRVDDGQGIDILSNGFRVRSNNWYETNLSGATYIYCAWAEAPTVNLYGGQSNAR